MIPISKPFIGDAERQAVIEVLESGTLVQGPRTALLEEHFAAVCETKHAVAVVNGTAALHVALLAHEIGSGDEVITTPFTFIASVNSIIYTGARPIFVDVEADSFKIDPALIEAAITPRTKAIMPVHLFGNPCKMDAIMDIAERHQLAVIEDAAQAIGAHYDGRPVGSFGTACFSLYATKNVMSGEGGMITTSDDGVAQRCRMLRNHGMRRRYYHDLLGYNFRLSDLHAAIGLAQLERLPDFTAQRRANAAFLNAHLRRVFTPAAGALEGHVWHQYTVRIRDQVPGGDGSARDAAVEQLARAGVGTGIYYPIPANKQAHLAPMGYGNICLPVAEQLSREVLSLPVHPQLSRDELETIVREVNRL